MARRPTPRLFKPINPQKYKGDPTNIVARSSWETLFMSRLDMNPNVLEWSSEEIKVRYKSPLDNRPHVYYPDFWVKKINASDGKISEVLVEIKPSKETIPPKPVQGKPTKRMINEIATWGVNDAKWKAAKIFCANRGWQFQILTEHELGLNQNKYKKKPRKK